MVKGVYGGDGSNITITDNSRNANNEGIIVDFSTNKVENDSSPDQTVLKTLHQGSFKSFISYNRALQKDAEYFKQLIEKNTNMAPCFLDAESVKIGENWHDAIFAALRSIEFLFVILSEETMKASHWIHVETGAALINNKKVIPILHGSMSHSKLDFPYNLQQSRIRTDDPEEYIIDKLQQI